MASTLVTQYVITRSDKNQTETLQRGYPGVSTDDVQTSEYVLDPNESKVINSTRYLVLELERPLDVTIVLHLTAGDVTIHQDIGGLIVLPFAATVTVANPTRLGYTIPVSLNAVTG